MTKSLKFDYPSIADILMLTDYGVIANGLGIDTIRLVTHYETARKTAQKAGLKVVSPSRNSPVNSVTKRVLKAVERDTATRYKQEQFKPIVEVVKLAKGKAVSNFMIIIRNTPELFDLATHHKKAKDTFCSVIFTGLHQPTSNVNRDAMRFINQHITQKRAFKLSSLDFAIDTQSDKEAVRYARKELFKEALGFWSKHGVISKGSSLYVNDTGHHSLSRILYYDKYHKETNVHKKELNDHLKHWKRLEITVSFDVTDRNNKGFMHYLESLNFINDLYDLDEIAGLAGIKHYDRDYLEYQINSFIDNRVMNNRESMKQFNSGDALERFKVSEFRRFTIPM